MPRPGVHCHTCSLCGFRRFPAASRAPGAGNDSLPGCRSGAGDIDVVGRQLIDGIVFAAFLECGFDAEDLAQIGDFLSRVMPPMAVTRVRMKSIDRSASADNTRPGWRRPRPRPAAWRTLCAPPVPVRCSGAEQVFERSTCGMVPSSWKRGSALVPVRCECTSCEAVWARSPLWNGHTRTPAEWFRRTGLRRMPGPGSRPPRGFPVRRSG